MSWGDGTYRKALSRRDLELEAYWKVLYALVPDQVERRAVHLRFKASGVAPARAKWPGWFPGKFDVPRPGAG